ncbi:hypothetical protein ACP70R_040454 [Stipagrostis hirtigluma subsp. patula]
MPLMVRAALLLFAAVAAVAVCARAAAEEGAVDPEVAACKQQCARQPQFGAAERRRCEERCDEYGRAKREAATGEEAERERDRCLHECRVGPPKPGCERRCREAYDRAARGRGGGAPRGVAAPTRRGCGGRWQAAAGQ